MLPKVPSDDFIHQSIHQIDHKIPILFIDDQRDKMSINSFYHIH